MTDSLLQIDAAETDSSWVIAPTGELDLSGVEELEQRVTEALAERATVLDLSGLSFIDSSGLALLISLSGDARERGQHLQLRDYSAAVRRLIELTGVAPLLGSPAA